MPLINEELDLLDELVPLAGRRVVELGCGAARLARLVLERHPDAHVTGLEVDERQHAKNLAAPMRGLTFMNGAAEAIPLEDGLFDVALLLKSLHHVPRPMMSQALTEVRRVLRPRGWFYCSEPVFAGDFNEIIRIFNDEQAVRAAAQTALDQACADGRFIEVDERQFDSPMRFRDYGDFEQRIVDVTFVERDVAPTVRAEVRRRFERHLQPDGATFRQPMRARLLRSTRA